MKIFTTLLFTLACLVHPAFAQDAVQTTGDYETPGPVRAEDFLPKSAFAGKRLFVQKTAQTIAQRADALASLVHSDQNIKGVKIWTNGGVSARLKAELDRRSIGFQSLSVR
jgi:hypothetical protein